MYCGVPEVQPPPNWNTMAIKQPTITLQKVAVYMNAMSNIHLTVEEEFKCKVYIYAQWNC